MKAGRMIGIADEKLMLFPQLVPVAPIIVAFQDGHVSPAALGEGGHEIRRDAQVAGLRDQLDVAVEVPGPARSCDLGAAVGRAVVGNDDLELAPICCWPRL